MRCIHCGNSLNSKTKDHVFPRSYYPKTTPANVQRWTVPSCEKCNGMFGKIEKELFIRLALCVGPVKAEAAGLSKAAVETLGIGVSGLSPTEGRHRQGLKSKILREIQPYKSGTEYFPGLGPHAGFPENEQFQIGIPEVLLRDVAGKIVRGCEYILGRKRIVEDPYFLKIYFAEATRIRDVLRIFDNFGSVHLGPGFQVTRAVPNDDLDIVMYKIDVWATWTIYAVIDRDIGDGGSTRL